jgi:hypothetical protein
VELQLLGPWRATGGAELEVARLELRCQDVGKPVVELVAGESAENPERLSRGDLAQLGILSGLRGATLSLEFDPVGGLTRISGLDETLDAARPDGGIELDAWVPLRRVFDAERWLTQLRAAGMDAVPARQGEQRTERRRDTEVVVPGRGTTSVSMTGRMAEESDGSPVLKLAGGVPASATFTGEADEPPAVLGAVMLGSVEAQAETMYLMDAARPLRGSFTVRQQFSRAYTLTEHLSFTLLVTP